MGQTKLIFTCKHFQQILPFPGGPRHMQIKADHQMTRDRKEKLWGAEEAEPVVGGAWNSDEAELGMIWVGLEMIDMGQSGEFG